MDLLLSGIQTVFSPVVLGWIMLGVTLGVVFGALPGISATMAIVLCISFTYSMGRLSPLRFFRPYIVPRLRAEVLRQFYLRFRERHPVRRQYLMVIRWYSAVKLAAR